MRSTSGYCFNFGYGVFSWSLKKQEVVTQSTVEAEYIVVVAAVNQALWLRKLLTDLDIKQEVSTRVFEDNQAIISIAMIQFFMVILTNLSFASMEVHKKKSSLSFTFLKLTLLEKLN